MPFIWAFMSADHPSVDVGQSTVSKNSRLNCLWLQSFCLPEDLSVFARSEFKWECGKPFSFRSWSGAILAPDPGLTDSQVHLVPKLGIHRYRVLQILCSMFSYNPFFFGRCGLKMANHLLLFSHSGCSSGVCEHPVIVYELLWGPKEAAQKITKLTLKLGIIALPKKRFLESLIQCGKRSELN